MESSSLKIDTGTERKLKNTCITLIKTNIIWKPKNRDEEGNKCPSIESFQNRITLPKIKIQEKMRITSKNYQTNKEEENENKTHKGRT